MNSIALLCSSNSLITCLWDIIVIDDDIKDAPYLAIKPNPGFTVIGTQNPIYMAGRVSASKAEKARRIIYTLEHYTNEEMIKILIHNGLNPFHAKALVNAYQLERSKAIHAHREIVPNFRDLQRQAQQITNTTTLERARFFSPMQIEPNPTNATRKRKVTTLV